MKITILVDQLYNHGGIEKLVAIKANYWSSVFGYEVSVISTENKGNPLIYKLNPEIIYEDFGINYNRSISYFSIYNILLFFKNIIRIQKYIFKNKPEYILVTSQIPIGYALPFLWKNKTKIIKEIHFTKYFKSKNKNSWKQKFFQFVESKYNSIVVLSKEEKSFYKANNVIVIPNPTILEENKTETPLIKKNNIATTIARFAPVKRLELLVEIWRKLVKKGIKWKLHIYGDANNSFGVSFRKLINKYKLQDYIFLKGITNEVNLVLGKSKVSLLVSEQECFPMIILESFSVGVPVISFDCPTGPRNIILNNQNGILIENNNINAFVNSFEKFAKSITLQQTLASGASKSSSNYQIDKIMEQWKSKIFN